MVALARLAEQLPESCEGGVFPDAGQTAEDLSLALRDAGCAVLVVSEELDELFEICDRLHVMAQGRLSPAIATQQATVELVGAWMSGLWQAAATGDTHVAA